MTVFLEALELAQVLLREDPVVIEAVKQVLAQDVCSMLGMKDFDPWKNKCVLSASQKVKRIKHGFDKKRMESVTPFDKQHLVESVILRP
ncbi:MAG: hypothetical protein KVP17_004320 [Porospora cf. gigantea B]|uniref:uncharacterized protein n=1 Tax=Porospora cf. gigantea B TaxID=2853592 RepID=UPI00357190C5|nr:MAG: hypothetical protein KVP17_004320 [Porospora cf. gigantea B]